MLWNLLVLSPAAADGQDGLQVLGTHQPETLP
jgi:hypothetical protein